MSMYGASCFLTYRNLRILTLVYLAASRCATREGDCEDHCLLEFGAG